MQIVAAMFNNWDLTLTRSYTDNLSTIMPFSMNKMILFFSFVLGVFGKTAYQWLETKGYYRLKSVMTIAVFVIGCLFISRVVTFLYFNF